MNTVFLIVISQHILILDIQKSLGSHERPGDSESLIDPELDGFGGTALDISTVFEALGRGLVVEPFLEVGILAAKVLSRGNDAQKSLVKKILKTSVYLS